MHAYFFTHVDVCKYNRECGFIQLHANMFSPPQPYIAKTQHTTKHTPPNTRTTPPTHTTPPRHAHNPPPHTPHTDETRCCRTASPSCDPDKNASCNSRHEIFNGTSLMFAYCMPNAAATRYREGASGVFSMSVLGEGMRVTLSCMGWIFNTRKYILRPIDLVGGVGRTTLKGHRACV